MRICSYCGHVGTADEIQDLLTYVGGQGYVRIRQCWDQVACWARQGWPRIDDGGLPRIEGGNNNGTTAIYLI